jgi:hypothetical protein
LARRPAVDESDADLDQMGVGSSLGAAVVVALAVVLAVAPAVVAAQVIALPAAWVGVALGCLGAAVTGVKLIAMALACGARLSRPRRAGTAVAYPD